MWAEDEGINVKYQIQDRDRKFSGEKFVGFRNGTARRIKTPVYSPMANVRLSLNGSVGVFIEPCKWSLRS